MIFKIMLRKIEGVLSDYNCITDQKDKQKIYNKNFEMYHKLKALNMKL